MILEYRLPYLSPTSPSRLELSGVQRMAVNIIIGKFIAQVIYGPREEMTGN